jgi:8-oxo-dGTP pyrophosphatase MutT (NUDIX family)
MVQSPAPRPASTVLAVRDADAGFEVLMVRRNLNSDFVGGAYVFPGGAVEPGDGLLHRAMGPADHELSALLDVPEGGRAYVVAALRELFEEAGLLVACDDAGVVRDLEPLMVQRLVEARRRLNAGEETFNELLESSGLYLDLRGVAYLAHWVTPMGPPRRFDTRFFVLRAPSGQVARPDTTETVDSVWLRPHDALAAHERGEYEMIFPTIRTLQSVEDFAVADDVVAFARSQASVAKTEPRLVTRDGVVSVLLAGDDGYDD